VSFDDPADPADQIDAAPAATGDSGYEFATVEVDAVSPSGGPLAGGTAVTITGSGFESSGLTLDKVVFDPAGDTNGSEGLDGVDPTVVSDTEITVTAPDATDASDGEPDLATVVDVSFTDSADPGNPVSAVDATEGDSNYDYGSPLVDSVQPTGGPLSGDNEVTITGSGFEDSELTLDKVAFDPTGDTNGSEAVDGTEATVVSDTEITVTAPDATEAAGGEPELATTVDATFDNPGDPGTPIVATPAAAGDNDYVFGEITPPAEPTDAVSSEDCSSDTATGTCDVTDDGTTVTTEGEGAVTVSEYSSDPVASATFSASGEYFDVLVAPRSSFSSLTIAACNLKGATSLDWWNGSAWIVVSPQTFTSGPPPCVTAVLSSSSSPTIAQLSGTVFAGVLPAAASAPVAPIATPVAAAPMPSSSSNPGTLAATGAALFVLFLAGGGLIVSGIFILGTGSTYRRRRTKILSVRGDRPPD
jgi:hypothetical protein